MDKKNREHNGGGEQNRREQKSGDEQIEKNPPRNPDGETASDKQRNPKRDVDSPSDERR